MLCPVCHTSNRDNAKFCKGCGRLLQVDLASVDQAVASTDAVETTVPSTNTEAQPTPAAEPPASPSQSREESPAQPAGSAEDPSYAPTQILSQQQMLAYHNRRWQQESQDTASTDIADQPTMLFPLPGGAGEAAPSAPSTPASAEAPQQDIAEMPTVIMQPAAEAPSPTEQSVPSAVSPESESAADATKAAAVSGATDETAPPSPAAVDGSVLPPVSAATGEQPETVEGSATTTTQEEGHVEQANETAGQVTEDFPVASVGQTIGERYEVTQVIESTPEVHIYEVTDQKGYLHCWNCGSEENSEDDSFCNNCGAELLNTSYIMHEYPSASGAGHDERVFQGAIVNTFIDRGLTYVIEQPQAAQSEFPNGVHLLASCNSDAGNLRRADPNEDSAFVLLFERVHESISSPAGIFIVADGMGGHDNGQGASRMTINVIAERIVRELLMPPLNAEKSGEEVHPLDEDGLLVLVQGAVQDANTALCQYNQREKSDMGSTLTGFLMAGDHAYIFNVGDSRTYMLRDQKLYQVTNDHSLVGQLVAGGLIEPDDVYTHPQRSQIYRSIGDKLNVQIDLFKQQVHPGDILLSCSDGLWEMVRDPQITSILNDAPDPHTACAQLIEAANANGGEDNVSAVVVFVR